MAGIGLKIEHPEFSKKNIFVWVARAMAPSKGPEWVGTLISLKTLINNTV
jgi:hypothetical protein